MCILYLQFTFVLMSFLLNHKLSSVWVLYVEVCTKYVLCAAYISSKTNTYHHYKACVDACSTNSKFILSVFTEHSYDQFDFSSLVSRVYLDVHGVFFLYG